MKDIDAVDLFYFHDPDRPSEGRFFDLKIKCLTLFRFEELGIGEPRDLEIFRKDHGGGHDRAGETATPYLVGSGKHPITLTAQLLLVTVTRKGRLLRK
jgi:hypothetical protein